MRFLSFTSGSCGNCYYLGADDPDGTGHGILIDAGSSIRRVRPVLRDVGIDIAQCRSVLITHDHLDHIRFLGTFCKYMLPKVWTTKKLHGALAAHSFTKDHISPCRAILSENNWNDVDTFSVRYFDVPHDATQTVGYAIRRDGHLIVLMTDLESVPEEAMAFCKEADTVIIESNYDYRMLVDGPYPPELKKRILKEGHLSNDDCAAAIKKFWHPGLRNLFLCHLSGNNNTPQKAYDSAAKALADAGAEKGSVNLRILHRGVPSPLLELRHE